MSHVSQILVPALGSAVQEIIHLYDLRDQLASPQYAGLLRSRWYWVITALMIAASGIGTYLLYGEKIDDTSALFFVGAAFPFLFKNSVARVIKNSAPITAPGGPPGWRPGIGAAVNIPQPKMGLAETLSSYLN